MDKALVMINLETVGQAAAAEVVGKDHVEHVDVELGTDSLDRPAYYFTFLIEGPRVTMRPGVIRTLLTQALIDRLDALADKHWPYIKLLSRDGWRERVDA